MDRNANQIAVTFAGGLGLAAYHAGAYEALHERGKTPSWVTGSSAGAVTAAIVAGNRSEDRISRLRTFWNLGNADAVVEHPFEHLQGWVSAMSAHLFGSIGYFHPRAPSHPLNFRSLYDLAPMRQRLQRLVDFDRLSSGEMRITIAATDVESGDPVLFDSNDGPIEMDHLMASCGFLPEFAPVAIDGRLLVDGGFSINAPFDPILDTADETFTLFVLDLFSRDGERPKSMEAAAERKNDLMFGNQTFLRLKDKLEIRALKRELAGQPLHTCNDVFLLSYRAGPEEPGPEKSFCFSRQGLATRWRTGRADMEHALSDGEKEATGLRVIRRDSTAASGGRASLIAAAL